MDIFYDWIIRGIDKIVDKCNDLSNTVLKYQCLKVCIIFGTLGRQYDDQGKLSEWWDEQTSQNFLQTTPCVRDQYSNMKIRGVKVG